MFSADASATNTPAVNAPAAKPPGFGYRWTIVALLFAATTVNYLDRQVLGILAPTLTRDLGWSETDYAGIVSWFSIAYGFGLLFVGRFMDRVGVRKGLPIAVLVWSFAAMGHALVRTITGFGIARLLLGIGESGNFPASLKAVAEWFPKKERALAVGIFNAGTNVGVVLAAVLVPLVALHLGWRWAFVATGTLDLLWLLAWLSVYREPDRQPRLKAAELAYIRSDPIPPITRMPWSSLIWKRQTWAFIVGKMMTDPVWFFYLFWLPKFLDKDFGVKLSGLALPLIVIYVAADFGSVFGGWLSGAFMQRGWTVNRGRKTAMLVAALLIVPTMFAPMAESMWVAVAIVSVAAASHQWWSANLFTLPSDLYPREAVASVVGIGGCFGMFASFFFQRATGRILEATGGNYQTVFFVLGLAYVTALLIIHFLVPKMEPATLES